MSAPRVVVVARGDALVWVQDGRGWLAERESAAGGFTPWRELSTESSVPGLGGYVLTQAEVARLVPPPISHSEEQNHD